MGKNGKKAQAGKPKKLTPKDVSKRLNALAKKVGEELKGAELFAPLPPTEDCAICLVPLSRLTQNKIHWTCCGNMICTGCDGERHALVKQNGKNMCPFCREIISFEDEFVHHLEARALKKDHLALRTLGVYFMKGDYGLPKDELKALDCWIRAVELGSPGACSLIAAFYLGDHGISKDMARVDLFYSVGALRGCVIARHNIGNSEYETGNCEIGIRHWKIAAEAGSQLSLNALRSIYNADGKKSGKEFISKECMDSLYRVCHDAQEEVKSEEREKHCHDDEDMKC